jgi:hypothetical protein
MSVGALNEPQVYTGLESLCAGATIRRAMQRFYEPSWQ